ncbi:MAG: ABC transporter permease [Phycisphaerales bacterium]|nr:ABC transporter permease [Phycisphaerales bacterium]
MTAPRPKGRLVYKLFLTLRYLRKRRIAYFAIAAVTLCTAMVLIVMSVMGGFLDELKRKARGILSDLIVDNRSASGFPLYQEFIDEVSKWPEVAVASPVIYSYALLRFPDTEQTATVRAVGLRLKDAYVVNAFKDGLFYEKFYPDTTTLEPQKMPVIGYDPDAPRVKLHIDKGDFDVELPPRRLPPELQAALDRAMKDGVADDESVISEEEQLLRKAGMSPIIGVYDEASEGADPGWVGDELPGIIIGRDIVAERASDGRYRRFSFYPRGMRVILTLIPVSTSGSVDTPVKAAFRYADDSRSGIYDIDSQHVYCDFSLLQKLLEMSAAVRADGSGTIQARTSQVLVKTRPGVDAAVLAPRLEEAYRKVARNPAHQLDGVDSRLASLVRVYTWEQSQAHIIAPVEKERQLVTILFGIISLVAVVLVLCILYMIVLQKTRDIGIVKSIGGSSAGVAAIFVFYGAAVGIIGAALGTSLGYAFVVNINEIQAFLVRLNPAWQVWDRSVYSFDSIPSTVKTADMIGVVFVAICAATFGSLAAAWRAGSMQPVEALRYE